jgi:hypothetical protein
MKAIFHVVYEYANLVSSGELLRVQHNCPINTHIQDAFLLNCRKMSDFFERHTNGIDIVAADFLGYRPKSGLKKKDVKMLNNHLAHLKYYRLKVKEQWNGENNEPLLQELRNSWSEFIKTVPEPYKSKFDSEIAKVRKKQGFENINL